MKAIWLVPAIALSSRPSRGRPQRYRRENQMHTQWMDTAGEYLYAACGGLGIFLILMWLDRILVLPFLPPNVRSPAHQFFYQTIQLPGYIFAGWWIGAYRKPGRIKAGLIVGWTTLLVQIAFAVTMGRYMGHPFWILRDALCGIAGVAIGRCSHSTATPLFLALPGIFAGAGLFLVIFRLA